MRYRAKSLHGIKYFIQKNGSRGKNGCFSNILKSVKSALSARRNCNTFINDDLRPMTCAS
jgi:hypothetical protein